MALDYFPKKSFETFWISVSFANDLGPEEIIESSTVEVVDKNLTTSTDDIIVPGTLVNDEQKVKVQVKGGEKSLSPYTISFKIVSNANPETKWENNIKMILSN